MSKAHFINREIWVLTIMGAFQRANVYNSSTSEIKKNCFKRKLKGYLDNLIESNYSKIITEAEHITNIHALIRFSENFSNVLTNGKINFGVAQKMLNLYLNYHWCLGIVPTPPHFPVDRIIQEELGYTIVPWTKMEDETEYLKIIEHAKKQLKTYNCKNIAELELLLFSRNL